MIGQQYYRLSGETEDGTEGIYFYEVCEGLITRQLCLVNDRLYWADINEELDEKYGLTDQPEFDESIVEDYNGCVISKETFEGLWHQSKNC